MPTPFRQRDWDYIRRYLDMEERANGLPELGTQEPGTVDHPIIAEWLYRGSAQPTPPQGIGFVAERLWQREQLLDGWSEFTDATIAAGNYVADSLYQVYVNDEIRRARAALGLMPDIAEFLEGHAQAFPTSDSVWEGFGLTVNAAPGGSAKHMNITKLPQVHAHPNEAGPPPTITIPPCDGGGDPATVEANMAETTRHIDDGFALHWHNDNALTTIIRPTFSPLPTCYPFNNSSWCPDGGVRFDWPTPDDWPLPDVQNAWPPFLFGSPITPVLFPEWGWPLTLSELLGNDDAFAPQVEQLAALQPWTSCKDGVSPISGWSESSPADPGFDNVVEQIANGFLNDYPALLDFYFGNVGIASSGSPSYEGDWMTLQLQTLWGGSAQIMVRFGVAHLRGTIARGAGGGGDGTGIIITNNPSAGDSNQAVYDKWGPVAPWGRHWFPIRCETPAAHRALEVNHDQQFGRNHISIGTASGGAQTLVLDGISWPTRASTPGAPP